MIRKFLMALLFLSLRFSAFAQTGSIRGRLLSEGKPVVFGHVGIMDLNKGTSTDEIGNFEISGIPFGTYQLQASCIGYETKRIKITIANNKPLILNIHLANTTNALEEVVVTGTMREATRAESPVPIAIVTPKLFRKNPTPSLFEAVGMINGVQSQINCNVCNTGDIHINGMEGPYTMMLIDGVPIVSALSTVYGLSGIPNSLVERIEVVKGPASALYGSEAMGGIINVITKDPVKAPRISADVFGTTWGEVSTDISLKFKLGESTSLLGINYFNYQNPLDKNEDGFTDVTLQDRISVFNKWSFQRQGNRVGTLAARYVYEDRWGGEMDWSKKWRGSNQIYGESIYTKRAEIIGMYQLPLNEKIYSQFSYNWHNQNSWYGTTPYMANQQVAFVQAYWDKPLGTSHNFLVGTALRYNYYDDNTPATTSFDGTVNEPAHTFLPGVFIQDEWSMNKQNKLLVGYRYDYDKNHGHVHSPRMAYKWSPNKNNTVRASLGTGFRVVNLFTEDHAALSGAREVVITEDLNPERSYNGNLNYVLYIPTDQFSLTFDVTGFYSYFTNKIVADLDTDPQKIIYDNLKGHAVSQGVSLDADLLFDFPLKITAGISYMDVFTVEDNAVDDPEKKQQLHAPTWSGNFVVSYTTSSHFTLDLTGEWNGPMRLPVLPHDYRPEYSPWFCIANIQVTKDFESGLAIYGGIKNIFNFIPEDPIMRPFDPFNKKVDDPLNNPYGYTFDPSYNYASLQGTRLFLGMRYNLF